MDTIHWPQMKPMEEISAKNSCSKPSSNSLERRPTRPPKDSAVNCPRCNSTNTKFCYYNNYSLSQPRYFCKTCRRYWTEGGSLRNVPVGGGSRKNKRSSSSAAAAAAAAGAASMSKKLPDLVVPPASTPVHSQNPRMMMMMHHEHGRDLNLGFPPSEDFKTISELIQVPNFDGSKNDVVTSTSASALELLTGITTRGMINSFMPIPIPDPMSEFKIPTINFSLDGNYGEGNSSGRLLFPFEDLKTTTSTNHDDGHQNRDQMNGDTNGFWSGMLGGAGSW